MRLNIKASIVAIVAIFLLSISVGTSSVFAKDIPPSKAGEIVKKRHGGKVINIRTSRTNTRTVHKVKIIRKGRIRSVPVDAKSGKIIK